MISEKRFNAFDLPGKLGNPLMRLQEEPRLDPRIYKAMERLGLFAETPDLPVNIDSTIDEIRDFCNQAEMGYEHQSKITHADWEPLAGVEVENRQILGSDGNEIDIFVHRPRNQVGPLPGILHLHGGGMVLMSTTSPVYDQWKSELANSGLVVVGVEFRNAGGRLGPHPFPAGLNDCVSALRWMYENKDSLNLSGIIISGESGGGNLAIATCLKAKMDGFLDEINGVYAQAPLISNRFVDKDPTLLSLFECDGYVINLELVGTLTKLYDPFQENKQNPLAWPIYAQSELLEGLPPHFFSQNQLDPHRDEGIAYASKLLAAGVSATSRTINGTYHVADMIYRAEVPDIFYATISSIKSFSDGVTGLG